MIPVYEVTYGSTRQLFLTQGAAELMRGSIEGLLANQFGGASRIPAKQRPVVSQRNMYELQDDGGGAFSQIVDAVTDWVSNVDHTDVPEGFESAAYPADFPIVALQGQPVFSAAQIADIRRNRARSKVISALTPEERAAAEASGSTVTSFLAGS